MIGTNAAVAVFFPLPFFYKEERAKIVIFEPELYHGKPETKLLDIYKDMIKPNIHL